ncbi:hypothetical protein Tco_1278340, partial [Tanacetum coccineum]
MRTCSQAVDVDPDNPSPTTTVESSNLRKPDNPPIVYMLIIGTIGAIARSTHRGMLLPSSELLPGNTVTNPKEDLKGITTRSGVTIQGPKAVNHDTESRNPNLSPMLLPVVAPVVTYLPILKHHIPFPIKNTLGPISWSSINLMPYYSVWKDLALSRTNPNLHDARMLADRSITEPIGIAKDVHLMVGKFQFQADFVVVDFEPDPRVPLILGRNPEGDILLLEEILNSEPPPPLLNQKQYLSGVRKELKLCEAKTIETSIDYLSRLNSRELSPHLNTHFKKRRVNPKIHDVIKKEVEKLLDAGLIYPISDSPWVSPIHCVPKKGGMTVITNDENELIPTRLVMGWR